MVGKRRWVAGVAVAAVLVVTLGVAAVAAQSGEDQDGTSFLDRVAAKLGIDTPRLEQAIGDARNDEIDAAVADGELTQEQADRLKERLDQLPDGAPFAGPLGRGGEFHFGFKFGHGPGDNFKFELFAPGLHLGEAREKLAEFLGISTEQLREELQADGATMATVAEAHGKSRDDLKRFIRAEAEAALAEAVEDGHLTQERVDAILARFDEHIDMLLDAELGKHFGEKPFRFRGDFKHERFVPNLDAPEQDGFVPALPGT